jgi:hypothetical protein
MYKLKTSQHGFKKGRSTVTAALELQDCIARAMDEDNYVAVASMDLSAAFDVLNVDLLLLRMRRTRLPGDVVDLVSAWLKNRIAYVEVDMDCSEFFSILFGSGQGSILGPILFNFYIATLVILKEIITYADDNYQLGISKDKQTALQKKVIEAEQCMSGSGLKVNIGKTELVVFHRFESGQGEIKIRNITIKSKPTMSVLGVIFHNRLTWDSQIDKAILKSRSTLQAMKTVKKYFTQDELLKLLTSNVLSKLYYASAVWLIPNLKEKTFKKLFSHSGKILKLIDSSLSFIALHKKFKRATPKLFALYQTSVNLFNCKNKNPFPIVDHLNNITLTNRRNQRLTFVRQNHFKVGLNCVENRMRSISNAIDKAWLDLSEKSYKLQCKIRVIQCSLESL